VKRFVIALAAGLFVAAMPGTASAAEIFGGLYVHGVDTPLTLGGDPEDGLDVQLGWRGNRIGRTVFQPYAFGAINTAGETNYAAVGLSAKFGSSVYIRPGLGLAVHSGSDADFDDPTNDRIEFGSRILFAPEVAVGMQLSNRLSTELSWVHLSHAQLFGKQNPGLDAIGVRVNLAF